MLRLHLAALAAAVLVGACGGDPDLSGNAPSDSGAGELALAVSWDEGLVAGAPVTWVLTVTNGRPEPVTLEFRNGQQGDVVLTTDDGSEVYRWSADRSFTGALVEHPLPAGASLVFELAGEQLAVEPGTYQLQATVPSEPPVPPVEQTVTVG
jgi:hypothetical protein